MCGLHVGNNYNGRVFPYFLMVFRHQVHSLAWPFKITRFLGENMEMLDNTSTKTVVFYRLYAWAQEKSDVKCCVRE